MLVHRGLKELLDAVKRDLGAQQYADVSEEDAAMLDKLKQDISAAITSTSSLQSKGSWSKKTRRAQRHYR